MSINYDQLSKSPRLLMEVKLKPLQGERFQPTGFADLGAARYSLPSRNGDGAIEMLLVESAQSVANRMELACWDAPANDYIAELRSLPFIAVRMPDGKPVTTSVLEAHRINSEYIMKDASGPTDFHQQFAREIDYAGDAPVQWRKFYDALLRYDPDSLIHGCFLEEIDGRLRITRALSSFIEATDVAVAESDGVKNNIVQPELRGNEGNVPFHRTEFVAREIIAYFNLDLALLRGYGFDERVLKLLIALALLKVRRFFSTGLRLRTACDLGVVGELQVAHPAGFKLPDESALLSECQGLAGQCMEFFARDRVTVVTRKMQQRTKPAKKKSAEPEETNA